MNSVKFIQIGDIHFPDNVIQADIKDNSLPNNFISKTSANRLANATKNIIQICDRHKDIQGLLFCGDLTSKGNLQAYEECIEYLNDAFELTNKNRWPDDCIHVVPGNHDIDRKICSNLDESLLQKFEPLKSAWCKLHLPILAVDQIRSCEIIANQCTAKIYSINSCLGCGIERSLPAKIKEELQSVFENFEKQNKPDETFSLLGEQLDTPAFEEKHISDITEDISYLQKHTIPIVLSHHNLLPQAIPRYDIYTDVINGGLVRARLSRCLHPIIYCHGHIHDDPIEIVSSPDIGNGPLVLISAPQLTDGFNVLEIYFNEKKFPIGCAIFPYRIQNHGSTSLLSQNIKRLRLRSISQFPTIGHEFTAKVVETLKHQKPIRFNDFVAKVQSDQGKATRKNRIQDALLEAYWFGIVDITGLEEDAVHWSIERISP